MTADRRFEPSDVVLVTGAAGDIGRAAAIRLADAGASLVVSDLAQVSDQLSSVADRCRSAGGDVRVVHFDVTDEVAVAATFDTLRSEGVVPNLLFNNAGYQGAFHNITDVPASDIRRVMDVNVTGVLIMLQAFARSLGSTRPGAVVNTASMAGVGGAANMAAYSASKAAVIGLTKSAAKDLAPAGIRVNAVSPAFIGPGAMWENQVRQQAEVASIYYADDPETVANQMIGQVPLRRYGSVDEVAAVVSFLLSAEASYLTGINIEIAGGAA